MDVTGKNISIITLLTYSTLSMKYETIENNMKMDDFCFNYGRTEEYGCISDIDTGGVGGVECTLLAAMVGAALDNITNVHIRRLYICIDNRFTRQLSSVDRQVFFFLL